MAGTAVGDATTVHRLVATPIAPLVKGQLDQVVLLRVVMR
jgi:hypothetical protein